MLAVATAGALLLSLASLLPILLSVMLFDAPGSERNPYLLTIAWSIWLFPVACGLAVVAAWIAYARRWRAAAYLVLLLPLTNVLAFGIGGALLQRYCGGRFAC